METINLPTTHTLSESGTTGQFSVEPLFPGYGSTLGNALRRVLLSSLEGAAIDTVEIEGVDHEFSAIPGVHEDVIALLLNLKAIRFSLNDGVDQAVLSLKKKTVGAVTAADFEPSSDASVMNPEAMLATLSAGATLALRVTVIAGRGYLPVEKKEERSKVVGVITTDSIFSPVQSVAYRVESTRVGQMTNYDRLVLDVVTDGSVQPSEAVKRAGRILMEQYGAIAGMEVPEVALLIEVEESSEIVDDTLLVVSSEPLDSKTRIEESGLSGRTANALIAAGYKTLSGLKRLSDIKLQGIKGLGSKGVDEVRAVLLRVQ